MPSPFHIFSVKFNYLFCFAVIIVASNARKSLIFFLVGPRSSLFSVSMCVYLWLAILFRYWWFHLPCGLHRCRKVFSCLTLSTLCTMSKSVYISFPHLVHFVGGISAPSSMAVLSVLSIFFWACEWGSDYVLDSCRRLDAALCALHMCASYSYGAFSI